MSEVWRPALMDLRSRFVGQDVPLYHKLIVIAEDLWDRQEELLDALDRIPLWPKSNKSIHEWHDDAPIEIHLYHGELSKWDDFCSLARTVMDLFSRPAAPPLPMRKTTYRSPELEWLWIVHELAWRYRAEAPLRADRMTWVMADSQSLGRACPYTIPIPDDEPRKIVFCHPDGHREERIFPPAYYYSRLPERVSIFQCSAWALDLILAATNRQPVTSGSPSPIETASRDEAKARQARTRNQARDEWLYDEYVKGTPHRAVIAELGRRKQWEAICNTPGIRQAVLRFATTHRLPKPEHGQVVNHRVNTPSSS